MEKSKLAQARAQKGWTLQQAADAVETSPVTFSRWEQGHQQPYGYNLQRLCKAFDMQSEELGFGTEPIDMPPIEHHPVMATILSYDLTMRLQAVAFVPQRFAVVQRQITAILEEYDTMNGEVITRREALMRLASVPFIASLRLGVINLRAEDVITQCSASIAACWELSKSDREEDLRQAFNTVSAFIPPLESIMKASPRSYKDAASLSGQCALLQCLLGWHLQGLKEAIAYAEKAVTFSKESGDIPLLLSTLDYLAWAHYYNKHGKQALKVINQAIPYLKPAKEQRKAPLSPHLQGGVYSTIALMRSRNGLQGTPLLHQAADAFFAQPETDDRFVYMDYTAADLVLNDGMVHYHQGDHEKALNSLDQLIDSDTLALKMPLPERSKIEGINTMALASLKAEHKDKERSLHFLKTGMTGSIKLQSEQRYSEAVLAYEIAEAVWPGDKQVKELRDLAMHW